MIVFEGVSGEVESEQYGINFYSLQYIVFPFCFSLWNPSSRLIFSLSPLSCLSYFLSSFFPRPTFIPPSFSLCSFLPVFLSLFLPPFLAFFLSFFLDPIHPRQHSNSQNSQKKESQMSYHLVPTSWVCWSYRCVWPLVYMVMRMEPRVLWILDKHSAN